ncbi:DUF1275 family protein [Streptomyces griseoincarnatus]
MTVLTVIAGAVDAVSFLTLGKVFCARVTGNALFPSFAPAGEGDVPVARAAAAVAAFPAGAAPGGPALAGMPPGARSDSPRHASRPPAGMNRAPRRGHQRRPRCADHPPSAWKPAAPRTRPRPGQGVPRGTSAGYAAAQSAQVPKISTVWATLT